MIYIICPPQGIYIELYINWLKVHLKRKSLKDKWLSFIKEGIFKMNRSHIIFKIRNRHSDEFFLACLQARREDFLQRYCQPDVKHFWKRMWTKQKNIWRQIWQSANEKVVCFYTGTQVVAPRPRARSSQKSDQEKKWSVCERYFVFLKYYQSLEKSDQGKTSSVWMIWIQFVFLNDYQSLENYVRVYL